MLVYPEYKIKEKGEVDPMEDDILKSLLEYGEDELCLDFMGYYKIFLDQDLLLYSLQHGNDIFVKKSLKAGAFDK